MTFVSKNAGNPKYKIDMSQSKYRSRRDCLLNILFHASELPNDLYTEMNLSYDNYRQIISELLRRGLIKRISKDGMAGYHLTLRGKRLTGEQNYMKYQDCLEEETDRHYAAERRRRKRQFAYLYALFDRVGISYETFEKPSISNVGVNDEKIYFYSAMEFKRMIGIEATPFQGSKLLGFLIGGGKVISVYRTVYFMPAFGRHETRISEYVARYFSVPLSTAIMICVSVFSVINICNQIIEGNSYDKNGVNTAKYKYFYVFPSDDSFMGHLMDLYSDHSETEQNLIDRYNIDTSDKDRNGRYRFKIGTGFVDESPVLVCAGNVNTVMLKSFVLNAGHNGHWSYILCRQRDLAALEEITADRPIKVTAIEEPVNG